MKSLFFKIKWTIYSTILSPLADMCSDLAYITPPSYFTYYNKLEDKQKLNLFGRCWLSFWKILDEFIQAILFIWFEK